MTDATISSAYSKMLEVIGSVEPRIAEATRQELADQRSSLKLIASENYASPAVLLTMGTWFSDKYAEGTVGHRFYAGCQNVDTVESVAAEHARELFGAPYAYVQPHSGIDANLVAYWSILANRVEGPWLQKFGAKNVNELSEEDWETLRAEFGNQRLLGMSLDAGGHLKIIDRAKDVGRMADGSMFAPKYIENKLKFFPYIKEAVAFGDKRDKVCAFVNIDFEAVGNWAERRNLPYAGYTDLAGKPEVLALIADCVKKVNADLAADERLAGSQISRFLVLHKELDADDGEMTRTRKVKRGAISDKYQVLVDALYGGKAEQYIETAVKFEDGRSGSVSATLKIVDVAVNAPLRKAA